jgi:hypothetical protein
MLSTSRAISTVQYGYAFLPSGISIAIIRGRRIAGLGG